MARSSQRTTSTTAAAAADGSRKAPAKKRKLSQLSEEEGEAKAKKQVGSKKNRKICSAAGCTKFAQTGGVCIKHGAKVTQCSAEGCTNNAQTGGVCMKHGAKVKRCSKEGCSNQAQKAGVCKKHGAKVKAYLCSKEGCANIAKRGRVCIKHGAKVKAYLCSKEGCTNHAVNGGVCRRHGAIRSKRKLCSSEGCINKAQNGGVCYRHGATRKRCSSEGCSNNALKGGVCWIHGAKVKCSASECTNYARIGGLCWNHGAKDKVKQCSSEGCNNVARRKGGMCFTHWRKKHRTKKSTAEEAAVAVPALPPIDLQPSETECVICFEAYNANEMVTCAAGNACSCVVCHDCLVTSFSRPLKMANGQFIEYDPTQCPACRVVGAFSLDETDAATVNREMNEMYCFEAASVGASDASTSHEQGDSEWVNSEEEDDEDD